LSVDENMPVDVREEEEDLIFWIRYSGRGHIAFNSASGDNLE
jgi:hypothetical protein